MFTHIISLSPSLCNTHAHAHTHTHTHTFINTHTHIPLLRVSRDPGLKKITTRHKSNWGMGNFGRKKWNKKTEKNWKHDKESPLYLQLEFNHKFHSLQLQLYFDTSLTFIKRRTISLFTMTGFYSKILWLRPRYPASLALMPSAQWYVSQSKSPGWWVSYVLIVPIWSISKISIRDKKKRWVHYLYNLVFLNKS